MGLSTATTLLSYTSRKFRLLKSYLHRTACWMSKIYSVHLNIDFTNLINAGVILHLCVDHGYHYQSKLIDSGNIQDREIIDK